MFTKLSSPSSPFIPNKPKYHYTIFTIHPNQTQIIKKGPKLGWTMNCTDFCEHIWCKCNAQAWAGSLIGDEKQILEASDAPSSCTKTWSLRSSPSSRWMSLSFPLYLFLPLQFIFGLSITMCCLVGENFESLFSGGYQKSCYWV